jgi:hypothetical protein
LAKINGSPHVSPTIVVDSALPMPYLRGIVCGFVLALIAACLPVAVHAGDNPSPRESKIAAPAIAENSQPVIVIGIVGGWIRADNHDDHIVQMAAQLNREFGPAVHAEIFENHHRDQARDRILALLDRNSNGALEDGERQQARIVLYGESWGGCETVMLARELQQRGIPVMLTVQVDSVAKMGENDELAPANVAQAVNFYQPHGLIHGRQEIRAEDASRTEVLGNFRFDYEKNPVTVRGASWFAKTFLRPHVSIENDPVVWSKIEMLIRSKLPAPAAQRVSASIVQPQ